MNLKLKQSSVKGQIDAICSKSYAHRICICDFLSGNEVKSEFNGFTSNDILATANCLNAINKGKKRLDCKESGSTLRFMLPLCASLGGEYKLFGSEKLLSRPNDELFKALEENGVKAVQEKDHITINGKLNSGEFKIRGDISSQYISGLLMALASLDGDSTIKLTTPISSKPYVDITIEVLTAYGINVDEVKEGYFVRGNQKFMGNLCPEGDWSNMSAFLVLGAINGQVAVKGLNSNSKQGDREIIKILKSAGASVEQTENEIRVKKSNLVGFTMDADNCPDLVPICAVLGAVAKGKTIIKNVQRLRLKESDRILSTMQMLKAFSVYSECDGKSMIIYGGEIKGGKVHAFNDHRIVMAGTVLSSIADGESEIIGAQAVEKSYPTFFTDYAKLGGKTSE